MYINIHGTEVDVTDAQVDLVRNHVRVIDGEPFLSAQIVDMMLRVEGFNRLSEGDMDGVLLMARVSEAYHALVDIHVQL